MVRRLKRCYRAKIAPSRWPLEDQRVFCGLDMDGVADRSKAANEHRLTSIREREKQKEAQKQLIRNALQEFGGSTNRNHVTFSDSDEDDHEEAVRSNGAQAAADRLLGLDGDDNLNITLEQRFKSKNTGKLLDLQSRYGNDSRFRLDDKFAESSDSSEDNESVNEDDGITSEAKRNMHIIDQITGHTIRSKKLQSAETFSAKSSQRYDPSNNSNMEVDISKMRKPVKKKKPPVAETDTPSNHDRFYDVSTDVLKNTFASSRGLDSNSQQPNTFSFIEMLKLDPDTEDNNHKSPKMDTAQANDSYAHEDITEDSSSSDEEISVIVAPNNDGEKTAKVFPNSTFFPVSTSDPLILGAAKNFCWNKTYDQMQKEWLEVKDILIKDYKKKHRDAKKKKADE